jgi:hypothetical protein
VAVFGWTKTPQPPSSSSPSETPETTRGKGRPTPTRREAEARNKRPLIGASPLRPGASKEERKAAREARRAAYRADQAKTREAMLTGDDRHLPPRDKGPARRFARDYVDARLNIGEYLLPTVLAVLVVGLFPSPLIKMITFVTLYGLVIVVAVDCLLLRRRVQRRATAKFGAEKARGVGTYAMMRALQLRRTRLPRTLVKRGEFPDGAR